MYDPKIAPSAMHLWHGRRHNCVDHALDPIVPSSACIGVQSDLNTGNVFKEHKPNCVNSY